MWLKRIIASFFGIRKSSDLETDMKNISLGKFIFLANDIVKNNKLRDIYKKNFNI